MELGHYELALRDYEAIRLARPPQEHLEMALLKKAFCLYKLKKRPKAIVLLEEFINKYPTSHHVPEGLYYLARLYWDVNEYSKGENVIGRLIEAYPSDLWTEKGMLILGLMKEEERKWSQASKVYHDMKKRFPKGELMLEVYWRWGWTEYLAADYAKAAQVFKDLIQFPIPNRKGLRDKAIYWYARTLEKTGKKEKSQLYYEELANNYPYTYYGIKGRERRLENKASKHNFELSGTDKASIIPTNLTWTNEHKYYLERIRELAALALYAEVQQEFKNLMKVLPSDIGYQYHLSKFFYHTGFYYETIKILTGILLTLPVEDRNKLPIELWRLLYPFVYWDQVKYHADKNRQDPYLIMALIRQESAFQSGAISSSGACGLMQILPSTGKFIFQSLDKDAFQKRYLFDPHSNISLGIWYLNYVMDKFDQNLILALAGYNAM
jgi:TolA-binding protein